jgi:phosphate transport system substrate-binding protein
VLWLLTAACGRTGTVQQANVRGEQLTSICGTGEEKAAPPSGISKLDAASARLSGAGSTFVGPLMSVWINEFQNAQGVQVVYQGVGSGAAIEQISAQAIDFGATDAPMTDEELAAARGGAIVHIPLIFGAVAPAYHVAGQETGLRFTGELLGKIFAGQVTHWNDPELTSLNPDADLPPTPITVVHRSDSSGTTAIWTDFLTKTSPSWVQALGGADKSTGREVAWPVGSVGTGNEGVSVVVNRTEGALGYVELTYALSHGLQVGLVKNRAGNFIQPCVETVTASAKDFPFPPDLRFSLTDPPGANAFPITGATWALVYENQADERKAKTLVNFLVFVIDEGQTKARLHNYAPLSLSVRSLAIDQIKKIKVNGVPLAR